VTVGDADISGLVLRLEPTVAVSGKVTLETPAATLPPAPGSGLMIDMRLADSTRSAQGGRRYALAREDRTFTVDNLFGRRVIDVYNVPRGWYLKSIRYGDREIIDTPVTFRGGTGAPSLELVLSDRGAVVNGTVVGEDGTPVPSATVCLLRKGSDGLLSVAATTRGISAGRFTLGPARGGEYVVVALPAASEVMPNAPQDRLQRLAAAGERLTLSDLDERSVQLHVVRER
jgi:hypothetical protein